MCVDLEEIESLCREWGGGGGGGGGGRPMIRAVVLMIAGCCDSFNACLMVRSSTPTPMKLM